MTRNLERAGRVAGVIARIAEVVTAAGAVLNVVVAAMVLAAPESFSLDPDGYGASVPLGGSGWNLSVAGRFLDVEIRLLDMGTLNVVAAAIASLSGAVSFVLLAMLFHQVAGMCGELAMWVAGTKSATDDRSLHAPLACRLRRIGIVLLAMLVVEVIAAALSWMLGVSASLLIGVSTLLVVFAVLSLLLGAVFDYVATMQREMDGLV